MVESVSNQLGTRTLEERRAILTQQAAAFAGNDGKVANESPTSAIVTKGKPVSGIYHPILTVMTLGLWGIVWFSLSKFAGEKRYRLSVDEQGEVTTQKI
jgi:hypothetical protein